MFYNDKSRPVNFCLDQLILKLLALIGEWNQNLSEKTVSENVSRRFIRRLEVSQGLYTRLISVCQPVADPRFPRGVAPIWRGGALTYYLANFAESCMKMKKKLNWERVPRAPIESSTSPPPPWVANRCENTLLKVLAKPTPSLAPAFCSFSLMFAAIPKEKQGT